MHLVYIDDSQDQNTRSYTFSAIAVPSRQWRATFDALREHRRALRASDSIYVTKELHAWEFVSGRGNIGSKIVFKGRRCELFKQTLSYLAKQEHLRLFNSILERRQDWAFERLLNRINRTMKEWDSQAVLICDEGKEADYTRLVRKMGVFNPIPSRYGVWKDTGTVTKNIKIEFILEDPFFKKSERSFFIQMADFCAYALLRRERQIASKNKYGLHEAFDLLAPICVKEANSRDPLGVIR